MLAGSVDSKVTLNSSLPSTIMSTLVVMLTHFSESIADNATIRLVSLKKSSPITNGHIIETVDMFPLFLDIHYLQWYWIFPGSLQG